MKNLLFVSAGLESSDTSAAIRNRRLISELRKYFNIYAIEIAPMNAAIKHDVTGIKKAMLHSPIHPEGSAMQAGTSLIYKMPDWLKRGLRFLIPDKYSIGLLKYDFSKVFPDKSSFDVILTSSDPKSVHFCLINRSFSHRFINKDTRIIQYWGDPWYGDLNFYTNWITKILERRLMSLAHHVIFNSILTFRSKSLLHAGSSNFHFLSRGLEPGIINLPDVKEYDFDKIRLLYAGDYFSASRNINPLIAAMESLEDSLVVIGDGKITGTPPKNVLISPRISFEEAQFRQDEADILVVILNKAGGQIPGKLYDYAASTHPIIVLYEDDRILKDMPFPSRFMFVKNDCNSIAEFLQKNRKFRVNFLDVKKATFSHEVKEFLAQCGYLFSDDD